MTKAATQIVVMTTRDVSNEEGSMGSVNSYLISKRDIND